MDWLLPLLVAPFIGSALGVVVRRLPHGPVLTPARSTCEHCAVTLRLRDLVPLLSYAALRGRCSACGASIASMHWHIELAAMLVPASAVLAGLAGTALTGAELWAVCGLGWTLLALAWIDAETMLLPDVLTLPLLVSGLVVTWALWPWAMTDHALAAATGWAGLETIAWAYRHVRGREGIGGGDAKLLGALGAWVGLDGLAPVLLLAALLGLLWAGGLRLRKRMVDAATPIPLGVGLAIAGWTILLTFGT